MCPTPLARAFLPAGSVEKEPARGLVETPGPMTGPRTRCLSLHQGGQSYRIDQVEDQGWCVYIEPGSRIDTRIDDRRNVLILSQAHTQHSISDASRHTY